MADTTNRDNRLVWGLAALGLIVAIALIWQFSISNSVTALDQRTQAAQTQFASLATSGDLSGLSSRQDELDARLSGLSMPDVTPLQAEVASLKETVSALQSQLAGYDPAALETVSGRLAALETRAADTPATDLAPVQTALATLTADFEALTARTDSLDASLQAAGDADLQAVKSELSTLKTSLAAINAAPVAPVPGADTGAIDGLRTDLNALRQQVAAIEPTDLSTLDSRISGVEGQVQQLGASVSTLPARSDFSTLQTQLDALATRVGESLAPPPVDLTPIETEIADLRGDIAAFDTKVASDVSTAELTALTGRLTALEGRVAGLPTTDAAPLATDLAGLKTDLGSFEQQLTGVARTTDLDTLRAAVQALADKPAQTARKPVLVDRVYFGSSSARLDEAAAAQIANIAATLSASQQEVTLMGFSDTSGSAEYNRNLSLRRASAVRAALVEGGVPMELVGAISGLGEDAPPVNTGDDAEEAGNRVVLIYAYQ